MGPTVLVNTEIQAGQQVLSALDAAGLNIRTAFWARLSEPREWRLFLITPSVDVEGPRNVYSRIEKILRKGHLNFLVTQMTVVGPHDPIAQEVRRALQPSQYGSTSALQLPNLGGSLVEDAYVYRSS